jgi:phage anti-repressor protein
MKGRGLVNRQFRIELLKNVKIILRPLLGGAIDWMSIANTLLSLLESMSTNIVQQDIATLLDGWIQAERNGVQFPVPFEAAWKIAEYSTKASAKRYIKDVDPVYVSTQKLSKPSANVSGVTIYEDITLSVDGLKDFCLFAKTEAGRQIRKYFIEAEKNWKLVQEVSPQFAEEIEILKLKREIAQIEAQKAALEDKTISLRHYVVTALPKPTADRILGVTEIKEIEYRDRIVKNNVVINDGGTINKTEICKRFGILTKNGKPDYPRLNKELDAMNLPSSAWEETDVVQTNRELKRDFLEVLDRSLYTAEQRQLWVGE